ncbi:hypothetical protein [Modestobacter sp. Leaf380]|uniref:hypothetical protein n=1 Tax=Modestobacter sp. Leaf380 TaxID=1736356 RepID=UPI0009E74A42|nr:hypothetical protein [Modestobacter sp. Leaf380]
MSALGTVASLASKAGGTVVRQVRSALGHDGPGAAGPPASGWLAVTVCREPAEVDAAALPRSLASFGDGIETRTRPAPGGKGTELAARLTRRPAGRSPAPARLAGSGAQGDLRAALREAKQLIEVGEVLAVDPTPHGERNATPAGEALEGATRRAPRGGVL